MIEISQDKKIVVINNVSMTVSDITDKGEICIDMAHPGGASLVNKHVRAVLTAEQADTLQAAGVAVIH